MIEKRSLSLQSNNSVRKRTLLQIINKTSKKPSKNQVSNQSGITLIALVVTIVVLLILSGITISLVFSDNGIIEKAREAANKTNQAVINEQVQMNELSDYMENMLNGIGEGSNIPEKPEEIEDIETLIEIQTENTKGEDVYGNIVMVPKGFKVLTEEAITVPQGIVIEDVNGNQFVWIPVGTVYKDNTGTNTSTIQLGRYTFDTATGEPTPVQLAYTADSPMNYVVTSKEEAESKNAIIEYYYFELSTPREGIASTGSDGENATAKNLAEFVQSVRDNGGYYIARYEASYASGYNSEGATDTERYANAKPLSKVSTANGTSSMNYVEGTLWNYITQINAAKVCQNMYANDNTVGVESDLVNSYAWDTAIVFIQEMDEANNNYANKKDGNGTLKNTGIIENDVCNIYDMAANVSELTTEYSMYTDSTSTNPCTFRGSGYIYDNYYTAMRYSYISTYINGNLDVGFRLLLYVK